MNPDNNRPGQPFQQGKPVPQQEMGFDKYVAIALVVGLIAGFVIGHSVGSSKSDDKKNATSTDSVIFGDEEEEGTKTSTPVAGTKIEVSDQNAGNAVIISELTLDTSYWVAIRDSHEDNEHPYILGARRIAVGTYTDLSIFANRATVAGKRYDVVFYKDGATFKYDSSRLIMNGENPAGATFTAN